MPTAQLIEAIVRGGWGRRVSQLMHELLIATSSQYECVPSQMTCVRDACVFFVCVGVASPAR